MNHYHMPDFHEPTPASEIESRMLRFQSSLNRLGLDGALLVYPVDLFYFSGTMQVAHLLIPAQGRPLLMVRRDWDRARVESPLEDVIELQSLKDLPGLVRDRLGAEPSALGLEQDVMPQAVHQRYEALWPRVRFSNIGPAVMEVRSIKSDYEVAWMRRSGDLARKVYSAVPDMLEEGRTEIDVAGRMTQLAYQGGHQNTLRTRAYDQEMFSWHVISGQSGLMVSMVDAAFGGYGLSPAFPMGASLKPIRAGEPVLIDFGFCVGGYLVDLTRMFSIGRPPDQVLRAYEALAAIEKTLLDLLRPGVPANSLFDAALARADDLGVSDIFLGWPGRKTGFVGHGVGLEISDPPLLAPGYQAPLASGMTVALELKMVLPGLGAVGLENTILIRENGWEKLTQADERFIEV